MLILRRCLSVSQSFLHFCNLVNHAKCGSNQIFSFTRFIGKSGSLVAGCCFSRQSDEENLFPKSNQDISNNQTVCNLQTQSTLVQHETDFLRMKRNCDSHDDISSQLTNVNTELLVETIRKKQKTEDDKIDSFEEVTLHSEIPPISENLDFSKTESVRTEIKKPGFKDQKPEKQRPNYFVAIKVSDAQIIKNLNELQKHVIDRDHRLKKSMISLSTLHITLMVMYIGDTETHARALKTLENIHQEHNDDLSKNPLKLEFKGLSNFQNRVLYAKLTADDSYERLNALAESVKEHYAAASIFSTDSRPKMTPHLTIVKIRDAWKKKEFPKKIDPLLYRDFIDNYFGSQEVQSIQLLSMTDPKDEAGYYSGNEIYFSAFEPKVRRDYLNKALGTEEKKKNVKEMINSLMKEKLK